MARLIFSSMVSVIGSAGMPEGVSDVSGGVSGVPADDSGVSGAPQAARERISANGMRKDRIRFILLPPEKYLHIAMLL